MVKANLAGCSSFGQLPYCQQPHHSTPLQQILVHKDMANCHCIYMFLIIIVLHRFDVMFAHQKYCKNKHITNVTLQVTVCFHTQLFIRFYSHSHTH